MITKKHFLLFFLILSTLSLLACGKENIVSADKIESNVLRTVIPRKEYNLDPTNYKDIADRAIITQIFEGLTEIKNDGVILTSTDKITHSSDYKQWSFFLRNDLQWSNGEKIDATTYRISWINLLKNKNISSNNDIFKFFSIKGAKDFFDGKTTENNIGIRVDKEKNILFVDLKEPIKNFDEYVSSPIFFPTNEENIRNKYELGSNLITNGAFKIGELKEDTIYLIKNDKYWDNINTRVNKVILTLEENEIMAYEMFSRLEIDFIGLPFYDIAYERRNNYNLSPEKLSFPINKYSYIVFNNNDNILNNKELRKAMYSVIDTDFIANIILKDNSKSIFEHRHPSAKDLESAKKVFNTYKNQIGIQYFEDKVFTAYNKTNSLTNDKVLISSVKDLVSTFKLPIRVKNKYDGDENFVFDEILISTNNINDFYKFLEYKYNLKNIDNNSFLNTIPVIPINKLNNPVLVHKNVKGFRVSPSGDVYLKYIIIN